MKIKREINPHLSDYMTFRGHGIKLNLHVSNPRYKETSEKADEICLRVSALRKAIEAAGLKLNEFEQIWGLQSEQTIYLHDALKQHKRLQRYWNKSNKDLNEGWEKARDPLSDYRVIISFLGLRDEKDLPKDKIRSLIIWLYHDEEEAPLGNIAYMSEHFTF